MGDAQSEALTALTRFMVGSASVVDTLQQIVALAAEAVPPAAYAGITMLVDGQPTTSACSDPEVPEIDQAQYDAGSGPCLDAYRSGRIHEIPSTEEDERWPEFSSRALGFGIHSTLSIPMLAADARLGALNFYSDTPRGFSGADQETGQAFAVQAAVVLSNVQAYWDAKALGEQLQEALTSRATIEQAKGILMAQSPMTPDAAFDALRSASQRENRKLRDIAEDIVRRHSGAVPTT